MTKISWHSTGFWPPVLILLSALFSCALILNHGPQPLRLLAAVWIVVFCPGYAIVRFLQINDRILNLTLAVALSLSIATGISVLMVDSDRWYPNSAVLILGAVASLVSVLDLILVQMRRVRPMKWMTEVEP